MKRLSLLCLLALVLSVSSLRAQQTKIEWDEWGVPYITASTEKELFFAQGWAQMQAHANLILKLYGISRGKAAAYWGPQYEQSDRLIHNLDFPHIASSFNQSQKPEVKLMMNAFAEGMNAYAKAHPEAIDKDKQMVLPVSAYDINMHSLFIFVTRFTGGGELDQIANWQDVGSNAMAIAPKRSASGNAMLLQNPHLPWGEEFTWFESGLNLNGKLIHGANLVGMPGIGIGFNENLGWTHTNNTLDNADSFDLTLKDGGYLMDGKVQNFTVRPDTIWVKQLDGKLLAKPFKCYNSAFGNIFRMGSKKALAIKMAGMDCPNASLQWWKMANAENFEQFTAALKMQQVPFWNITYADKQGNIFYLFNGEVPKRAYGTFADWDRVIPGNSSKDIWKGYFTYDELPKLKNPVSGWLQNTNDPPWTSTLPREIDKNKYPAYIAPDEMTFRTQQSVNMLMADKSITFEHLLDYKLSTHVLLADRVLDDLLSGIDNNSSPILQESKAVLSKWNRKADGDSKGMLLFYTWAEMFDHNDDRNYTVRWDREHPNTTPNGILDKKRAVTLLENAADTVKKYFGDLSTSWGTYARLKRGKFDLPANGVTGELGVFRVANVWRLSPKMGVVTSGDSYFGVVEFGKKVRAKVLLSYGNSSQKNSAHYGDQLKLFSEKQMRDALVYPEDLQGHVDFTELREGDSFVKKD
ncbi:acylase [Mucilaginibacter corticis]|uniref:Acylase n=1 Tax=Mucilaginibacter corticis TaxID=2597670 RepID=A0A556MVN8_9SPHI|nr:acylase [Mucilaginibacter corticis]TSJ43859.1 acylase [Mucilaginibacter corticis]